MRLGPYEVLEPIGHGGAGTVFRASGPSGEVALKLLDRKDPEALARFERERRLQGALGEAEGFVPLLDSGSSPRGPYLVMPLLPGGTLGKRLGRETQLSIADTVALGVRLARALGRAHERGIVHRDVKPDNVLFTHDGRALVADLGLAKHFALEAPGASQSQNLSRSGQLHGTAGYMAPEQMTDAKTAGPEADVFALGAILYECLAGRPAFHGTSVLDLVGKVSSGELTPVRELRPDAPAWLAAIVARALALDPGERFESGESLARALEAGAPAHPGRRRLALLAGALLLAGVVAVVAVALTKARDAARIQEAARARKDAALRAFASSKAKEKKGDYEGAIADATLALELEPGLAVAWAARGTAEENKGDHDAALRDCTRALALDPRLAWAWTNRGTARLNKGDKEGALSDLTKAVELDPKLMLGWANRGAARITSGDFEGAILDCTRAIQLDPRNEDPWVNRGLAKQSVRDLDGAIADYTKALELAPGMAAVWENRGTARLNLGDHEGAIADCTKAIELAPGLAAAFGTRGEARVTAGDNLRAIADLARCLELDPGVEKASLRRGLLESLRARSR